MEISYDDQPVDLGSGYCMLDSPFLFRKMSGILLHLVPIHQLSHIAASALLHQPSLGPHHWLQRTSLTCALHMVSRQPSWLCFPVHTSKSHLFCHQGVQVLEQRHQGAPMGLEGHWSRCWTWQWAWPAPHCHCCCYKLHQSPPPSAKTHLVLLPIGWGPIIIATWWGPAPSRPAMAKKTGTYSNN